MGRNKQRKKSSNGTKRIMHSIADVSGDGEIIFDTCAIVSLWQLNGNTTGFGEEANCIESLLRLIKNGNNIYSTIKVLGEITVNEAKSFRMLKGTYGQRCWNARKEIKKRMFDGDLVYNLGELSGTECYFAHLGELEGKGFYQALSAADRGLFRTVYLRADMLGKKTVGVTNDKNILTAGKTAIKYARREGNNAFLDNFGMATRRRMGSIEMVGPETNLDTGNGRSFRM